MNAKELLQRAMETTEERDALQHSLEDYRQQLSSAKAREERHMKRLRELEAVAAQATDSNAQAAELATLRRLVASHLKLKAGPAVSRYCLPPTHLIPSRSSFFCLHSK